MKKIFYLCLLTLFYITSHAQVASNLDQIPDPKKELKTVETSCGECNFGLPGDGCDVAVKIDGKAYYVDGVSIKEYGHPHHEGGFCVALRKAEIQGELVDGRFKATYFKLLDEEKVPKKN